MLVEPLILFLYKKFYIYQTEEQPAIPPELSTGLKTSAQFVVEMLTRRGIAATLAEAKDQNSVQALIDQHRPSRIILEAIWITPAKMQELVAGNIGVRWTVRVHSELPFLANEGMAIDWLVEYAKLGVEIAFNSAQTVSDYSVVGPSAYLPNYYPLGEKRSNTPSDNLILNIGCFGSIRPLKNQLIQAVAAIAYARRMGRLLRFHMNGARVEQMGMNNLKNIKALFAACGTGDRLILHPWLAHEPFMRLVAQMDICMQVSLSESFNIVAADAVSQEVPLVGSPAISWLPRHSQADPASAGDIEEKLASAGYFNTRRNYQALESYLERSTTAWLKWVR